jgi:hypothetical protein
MGKAISRSTFVAALSFALAACVSTQEMQLAPNVVRLDTSAKGALFVGQAGNATLKRAAEETLKIARHIGKLMDKGLTDGRHHLVLVGGFTRNQQWTDLAFGQSASVTRRSVNFASPRVAMSRSTLKRPRLPHARHTMPSVGVRRSLTIMEPSRGIVLVPVAQPCA